MMDLEVYKQVLEWKLDRQVSIVKEFGFDEAERALRQDMAAMKVVWYNSFLKDWWCFMRNTHPVLATCLSHRLHMVSKKKRLFVYAMLVSLHMTLSVLAAEAQTCSVSYVCDLTGTDLSRWCCTVEAFGLIAAYETFGVYGLSAIFALTTIIFGQVWFLIAACGCCQHKDPNVRHFWERMAKVSLAGFGALMFLLIIYDVYYIHLFSFFEDVAVSFVLMKSISFLGAFIFQSFIFYNIWRQQTHNPHNYVDKFHLTHDDYVEYLLATGARQVRFKAANSVVASASLPSRLFRAVPKLRTGALLSSVVQKRDTTSRDPSTLNYERAAESRSPASSQASQPSVPVASLRPSVSAHDQLGAPDAISPQPPSSSLGANSADIDGVPFVPPPRKPVPTRDALVQQVRETAEQAERARLEKKRAEAQLRAAQDGLQRTRSHLAVDAPVLGMRAPVLAPGGLLAPHLDPLYQRGRERSVSAPPPRAVPPPPPPPPEAMALPQPPALGGLAEDESWLGEEEGAASYERHMHDLEGISVDFPDTPEARPPATGGGAGAHGGQCAPSACRGFLGANSMRSSSRAGERAGHTCESDM
mmetsp:Transcript_3902/g.11011  ORF Transcript_3902/g.11011 Transcript_3902/m.11011 type:complete len:586 (-) Transcript_3902:130-1887(-)